MLRSPARLVLSVLALLALAAPSVQPWADGRLDGRVDSGGAWSYNWAGRLRPGPEVRSVGAVFNVPTAAQRHPGEAEYASVWDGIGGALPGTTALVQAGIHISVSAAGTASYSTFVEGLTSSGGFLFSSTPVAVSAGQWIEVRVSATGAGQVAYFIDNLSSRETYENTYTFPSDGSSAEWIVEAPFVNGAIATTPILGRVDFVRTLVNGAPGRIPLGIAMLSPALAPLLAPSPDQGQRFSVCPGAVCRVGGGSAFHPA